LQQGFSLFEHAIGRTRSTYSDDFTGGRGRISGQEAVEQQQEFVLGLL
jgi:hypothetical protein